MLGSMASSSRFQPSRLGSSDTKDVFLQHVFTDIKEIHDAQSNISTHMDVLTDNEKHAQLLCDHLDHILMHGLYRSNDGYWPCVAYYTHKFTVEEIKKLVNVATGIGKGRAWLNIALNEQVLESYLRMFIDNQRHIKLYYIKEAFLRDVERLSILLTMISGLDYVSFNLPTDVPYLDMSASPSVANSGVDFSIKPKFIGSVTPVSLRKTALTTSDESHTPSSPTHDTSSSSSSPSKLTSSLPTRLIAKLTSSNVKQNPVPDSLQTTSTNTTSQTNLTDETSHSPTDTPSHSPTDSSSHTPSLPSNIDTSSHTPDLPSIAIDTTSHTPNLPSIDSTSHTLSFPSIDANIDLPCADTASHTPSLPTVNLTGQVAETSRESPPPQTTDTEKMDSSTKQQPKLSFIDRFNQLSVQEEEKTSELVSRKKKATKGKKKKKKKDNSTAGSKNIEGSSTDNQPSQTLEDSVKESQATEIAISDIEQSLEVNEIGESNNTKPTDTRKETDTSIIPIYKTSMTQDEEKTDNEPAAFTDLQTLIDDPSGNDNESSTTLPTVEESIKDDDNHHSDNLRPFVVEPPRRTSHDYKFGETQSIEPTTIDFGTNEDLDLMGRAGSLVRERRRSPQPSSRLNEDIPSGDSNTSPALEKMEYITEISEHENKDVPNEEDIGGPLESLSSPQPTATTVSINTPPRRPMEITEAEKKSCDLTLDDNTRIVLSLDVFHHSKETAIRLVQAYVPQGPGRYQKVCVVMTNSAVYITQHDGTEGVFSHMTGVQYSDLDTILIGLGWQSFTLVYNERMNAVVKKQKQVVVTGSEAVSRSIIDTIKTIAKKSILLKKSDEIHLEAIERELIKLGSETSMEIVRYCLVYWEQLSGEPPLLSPPADISIPISGTLHVKELSLFMIQTWNVGYFQLIDGVLYHFNNDTEKSPKSSYPLRGLKCGGCTRAAGETKENAFKVLDSNGSSLVLAAEDEEDMTRWMQALCLASIGEKPAAIKSPIQKGGSYCAVLLTQNKIHVLREDWSNETVQLVTSISVQDINEICVEQRLPVYCTLKYDDWENETQGMWMLCFSSEYELGQFEQCLLKKYKEIFQVDLGYSELSDESILSRAHDAIELFRASWSRSDSITRGRTVFTFDND